MHRTRYAVTPAPRHLLKRGWRHGWQVLRDGKLFAVFATQGQAICRARRWAKSRWRHGQLAQVVVHSASGRIRAESTYGRDPYPPKG